MHTLFISLLPSLQLAFAPIEHQETSIGIHFLVLHHEPDGFHHRDPGIVATTDADKACEGVDIAIMVGGFPRKAGMERKDVMSKNVNIYAVQAKALEEHASKGVKVGRLPHKVLGLV